MGYSEHAGSEMRCASEIIDIWWHGHQNRSWSQLPSLHRRCQSTPGPCDVTAGRSASSYHRRPPAKDSTRDLLGAPVSVKPLFRKTPERRPSLRKTLLRNTPSGKPLCGTPPSGKPLCETPPRGKPLCGTPPSGKPSCAENPCAEHLRAADPFADSSDS